MSVSTDAVLFYGYMWDHDGRVPPGGDPEVDWCDKAGMLFGGLGPYEDAKDGVQYFKDQRAVLERIGVGVDTHCHSSYPMPYVYIRVSRLVANRGYPVKVPTLVTDPSWDKLLQDFCARMGYNTDGLTPGWYLVSDTDF